MSRFRVAGVLLVQRCVLLVAGVAPAFCCVPAGAASETRMDCCKGEGHSCPMKKQDGKSSEDDEDRIASLLFGTSAVLVQVQPLAPPPVVAWLENAPVYEPVRIAPADVPPPRA